MSSGERFFLSLSAGIVSAFTFFLFLASETGGVLLVFLPIMPLLLVGLGQGAREAVRAGAAACAAAVILTGLANAFFFALLIVLPVCYFLHRTLLWRGNEQARDWYPMIRVMAELSVIMAAFLMTFAWLTEDHGGLAGTIPQGLGQGFAQADPSVAVMMQDLMGPWSFMLFAAGGWLWVIVLYASAVVANQFLKSRQVALRPSLALTPHGIPYWLLALLALSGGLAFLGHGADRYDGEVVVLLLLLPYFLSGLALAHVYSVQRHIPMRRLWIASFYTVLICIRWAGVAVILAGLYLQVSEMLDRHNKIG